jgi:hypothetical protein
MTPSTHGLPKRKPQTHVFPAAQLAASWLKKLVFLFCLARKKAFMMLGYKHDVVRGGGFGFGFGFGWDWWVALVGWRSWRSPDNLSYHPALGWSQR